MRRRRVPLSFSLFAFQDIITGVTGVLLLITITLAILLVTTQQAIPLDERTEYHKDLQQQVHLLAKQQAAIQQDLSIVAAKHDGLSRINGDELKREVEYAVRNLKVMNARVADLSKQKTVLGLAWSEQSQRDEQLSTALQARNDMIQQELNDVKEELSDLRASERYYFNIPKDIKKRTWLVQISQTELAVAPVDGKLETKRYGSAKAFLATLSEYPPSQHYFVLFVRPSGIENFELVQAQLDLLSYDFGIDAIDEASSLLP